MIESDSSASRATLVVRRRSGTKKLNRNQSNLAQQAQAALATHPHLKQRRLRTRYDNGNVTIEGSVKSYFEKQLAQETLKNLSGVTSIQNQLDVNWSS